MTDAQLLAMMRTVQAHGHSISVDSLAEAYAAARALEPAPALEDITLMQGHRAWRLEANKWKPVTPGDGGPDMIMIALEPGRDIEDQLVEIHLIKPRGADAVARCERTLTDHGTLHYRKADGRQARYHRRSGDPA